MPADGEFRPLVQAALFTGCRYGELARLTAEDFNHATGTLHITKSKSGKPRHVILTDEGVRFFAGLAAGRSSADLLFRAPRGGPWLKACQQRPMRIACERARIKPAVGFHALRHTWASLAVMNGTPLLVVAKNLGHAGTKMVEQHYGHLAPSYVADEIRKGAPRFGFKPERKVATVIAEGRAMKTTKRKRAKTRGLLEQLRKVYGDITLSQAIEWLKPRSHGRPKRRWAPDNLLGYHVWFSVEQLKAAGLKSDYAAHKACLQLNDGESEARRLQIADDDIENRETA